MTFQEHFDEINHYQPEANHEHYIAFLNTKIRQLEPQSRALFSDAPYYIQKFLYTPLQDAKNGGDWLYIRKRMCGFCDIMHWKEQFRKNPRN